jgi:subtilisin family serine protease
MSPAGRRPVAAARCAASLLTAWLLACPVALSTPPAHVGPILGRLIRGPGISAGQPAALTPGHLRHYARLVALDIETDPPTVHVWMQLQPGGHAAVTGLGIPVLSQVGDLASAQVPLPRLSALAAAPGVRWVRASRRLHADLDVSLPEIGADLGHSEYNARGAGVVVGIIDDGIDFTHGDFRNANGTTRIKFLWNQWEACGNPPAGFGYGCLYTEADINNALSGMGSVNAADNQGHGTHVTGIAAGNGLQTGNGQPAGTYVGMAPEADLVYVKTLDELVSCPQCDAGDALSFIDQKAAELGRPWVTNMSFGTDHSDPHDGTDPLEQIIDALTGPGVPGQVAVNSAGNDRGEAIHISGTVSSGTSNTHTFTIPSYTPRPGNENDLHFLILWYENGDTLSVTIEGPTTGTYTHSTGDGTNGAETVDGVIVVSDEDSPTPEGTRFFEIQVFDLFADAPDPAPGQWTLRVTGDSINGGGVYDAWIYFSDLGGQSADWDLPDPTKLLTPPATSFHVTAVGAHVSRTDWIDVSGTPQDWMPGSLGELSRFSSPGPTRDDRLKPELTAPGQVIASALAAGLFPFTADVLQDGEHWMLEGTSFSTPHVTGMYALMLGLNPSLDAVQLRDILQETARSDAFTGAVPNFDWGAGKLDAKAALDMVVKPVTNLHWTSTTNYIWDGIAPLATTYNVYRARVSDLDGTFYGNCRASGLTTPSVSESLAPPLGDGFFYLVTGVKDGIEGLRGFQSNGTPRPSINTCP